jgi:extracellular elastinolytic metalloproteinase
MMSSKLARACKAALCISAVLACSNLALGVDSPTPQDRNFDARIGMNQGLELQARSLAPAMEGRAVANIQELSVEADDITGAVRSMSSQTGYLSDAQPGKHMDIAMAFVQANVQALGLTPQDLQGMRISDVVFSKVSGATHIYAQQMFQGIPVYNAQLQINVNRDGRIMLAASAHVAGRRRQRSNEVLRLPGALAPERRCLSGDSAVRR